MTLTNIVEKINAAFADNNIEGFLDYCSDDVVWTMVGHKTVNGKKEVRGFMDEMKSAEPPEFTVDRLFSTEDSAVCYGDMKMKDENGELTDYSYCDVYRFSGDKVTELLSYVIKHQDAGATETASA